MRHWLPALLALLLLVPVAAHADADADALLPAGLQSGGPADAGGWRLQASTRTADRVEFRFDHAEHGPLRVVLQAHDPSRQVFARTRSFDVHYEQAHASPTAQRAAGVWLDALVQRLRETDRGQLVLSATPAQGPQVQPGRDQPGRDQPAALPPDDQLQRAERQLALVLLLLAALTLPLLLGVVLRWLRSQAPPLRWVTLGFLLLAALLRVAFPHRLVMTYGSYELFTEAVQLGAVRKYGAGTPLLYHAALWAAQSLGLPAAPWQVIPWLHTLLGWASVPVAAALSARLFAAPSVAVCMTALVAVQPLFLRDHASESNVVPTVFFGLSGLLLAAVAAQSRRPVRPALAALVLLLLTAWCRPEFVVSMPVLAALVVRATSTRGVQPPGRWLWWLAAGLVLLPHLGFLASQVRAEVEHSRAVGLHGVVSALLTGVWTDNLLVQPAWSSPLVPVSMLVALATRPAAQRRTRWGLLLAGWLLFALPFVDMPSPSKPRLLVPALWAWSMLAAVGCAQGLAWLQAQPTSRRRALGLLAGAAALLSLLAPVHSALAPSNDQAEHALFLRAVDALPLGRLTLARLDVRGADEEPAQGFGLYNGYPDQGLQTSGRSVRIIGLRDLPAALATASDEGPVYVYLGVRCFAWMVGTRSVPASWQHPACAAVRALPTLTPVWEQRVENAPLWQDYIAYPAGAWLPAGLYRARGVAASGT